LTGSGLPLDLKEVARIDKNRKNEKKIEKIEKN
jgi:hypothetical protein